MQDTAVWPCEAVAYERAIRDVQGDDTTGRGDDQVANALGMVPVAGPVSIPFVATAIDNGQFAPTETMIESAHATLTDLRSMVDALAGLSR